MMPKIKVLLADDEPLAREDLARMISDETDFEVTGQAGDGRLALEAVRRLKPDVVFLDIDMPFLNGIEVALELAKDPAPPLVVFSTAFDQYAVDAFEANALDYILKPCRQDRLKKALEKIKKHCLAGQKQTGLGKLEGSFLKKGLIQKIAARQKNSKEKMVLDPDEIDFFHAESAEVFAHIKGQDFIVSLTLKELAEGLEVRGFAQCHKAYLVNLSRVQKISPLFSGNYQIILKTSEAPKVPLSRRYAGHIRSQLGGW
ncbi:MAG TPA: DNA-binding response regulator [Candidatus Omnitrophica bacterium]|nr:DNA-binding response regulator [Candidatus Omnitrophota bacterium]